MRILVLGGTGWLGGRFAALATSAGHEVTCLARGESGTVPPGTRLVVADRWAEDAYDAVAGQDWDAAVEVSWQPGLVGGAVAALGDRVAHWVYVSSASVYSDDGLPLSDELHPAWAGTGEAAREDYGPAKVACEQAVLALGPDRVAVARAGLIGGYGDLSDRYGYWPARIALATGDRRRVLTPGLDSPTQVIDVDDLAGWLLHAATEPVAGVLDLVGATVPLREVLDLSARAAGSDPELVAVPDGWLVEQGVEPWMGPESLPLWIPGEEYAGFMLRDPGPAVAAGLRLRPLRDTVAATLAWETEQGLTRLRRAGLSPARERELLAAWGR